MALANNAVKMRILLLGSIIMRLIVIGLSVWAVYWLFLKITGHSPSTDDLTLVLVSIIGGVTATNLMITSELKGRFGEYRKYADRRFDAIEAELKAP